MDWRGRLRDLVLAGGAAASLSGCIPGCGACNANPDPCCASPKSQACTEWMACEADGGRNDYVPAPGAQCGNGPLTLKCVYPGDDLAIPCPTTTGPDLGEHD